ncbi:MAG: cytochrome c3 family protein [Rudaea sp.]
MKRILLRILALLLLVIALALFLPNVTALAYPPAQPPIPHTLVGHSDCVGCHATGANGAPKYPADHAGRTNDICQACHKQAAPAAAPTAAAPAATASPTVQATAAASPTTAEATTVPATEPAQATPTAQPTAAPAAAAGGPPNIPHPLEGRDNCLACHQTGVGGAPKVPASHAGRTVDTCRTCHQPAQPAQGEVPQILPTPISHPAESGAKSTCVTCHSSYGGKLAQVVTDWQSSIHSQKGVSCEDCHGGDPTSMDKAMTLAAGFIGVPKKVDIPALCASCHSRVDAMRQYDLPTDQWSKYQQSVHGQKLAQGDTNVATCFTCHDGHATKEVNDPSSQVYSMNVPELCSSCHSNAQLMKQYGIPTDQFDNYKKSVHGVALLEKQDTRAPNCATCHGNHGAAPPGIQEVANVCGSCHTATQDYFSKSAHAASTAGAPKCVTCHSEHNVSTPSEATFRGTGTSDCGSCHPASSSQAEMVQSLDKALRDAATAVDEADASIKLAAGSALIMAPEEVKLAGARTDLITARAAQHTLDLNTVKERTDKATTEAKAVEADSKKAMADSLFRREFMGLGLGIMALSIGSLYIIRRELYKQLPKE